MEKPHWTEQEIELLKRRYSSTDKTALCKLFPNRSWRSIAHKGARVRIARKSVMNYLRPRRIGTLSHDDAVYLAGLLDGEGMFTVGIRRTEKVVKGNTYGRISLTPLVSITNTYQPLIEWCHTTLGGSTLKAPYEQDEKRKVVRTLQLARLLDIKALLEQTLPYLKVKRIQAELLLQYCNIRIKDKWSDHNPQLFEIAKQIRELNRKGKTPLTPPAS